MLHQSVQRVFPKKYALVYLLSFINKEPSSYLKKKKKLNPGLLSCFVCGVVAACQESQPMLYQSVQRVFKKKYALVYLLSFINKEHSFFIFLFFKTQVSFPALSVVL